MQKTLSLEEIGILSPFVTPSHGISMLMTSYTPFSPRLVIFLKSQWDSGGGEDITRGRSRNSIVHACIVLALCNLMYQC